MTTITDAELDRLHAKGEADRARLARQREAARRPPPRKMTRASNAAVPGLPNGFLGLDRKAPA